MSIMSDILTQLGQAAAIILSIYLFVNILIGLAFALVFMFAVAWVGEKAELIKKLRPTVKSVNEAIKNPEDGASSNKLVEVVHSIQKVAIPQKIEGVQHGVQEVEQKVNQGADRVAGALIEFRARTVQAQGVLKAFFLPGLIRRRRYPYALPEAATGASERSLEDGDYALPETATGASERSLGDGASASLPPSSSSLQAAPAPLSLAEPGVSDRNKRARVATAGDGSTGNASRA